MSRTSFRLRLTLCLLGLVCFAGLFLPSTPPVRAGGNSLIFAQIKKVIANDGAPSDDFFVTGLNGNTLVVGASGNGSGAGAAYVFDRNQGGTDNWGLVKKLTASDATMGDAFGAAVGLSGDTIVVGAYQNNTHRGAAYVFERNQGGANNWGQTKKFTASDVADPDFFASAIAIDGNTIVVGAYHKQFFTGAAYIFERNQGGAGNWGQVKKLTASDAALNDQFGGAVAINADTIAIGANGKNSNTGAAYIFGRNQGGANVWGQTKKLSLADGLPQDSFGSSIGISNDTVVVGAFGRNSYTGAAYVFGRNQGGAGNWGQLQTLTANNGATSDRFGLSVGISGDLVVVGADQSAEQNNVNAGAAYLFSRNQGGTGNWGQLQKLTAGDGAAYDYFGESVAITGDTVSNYSVSVGALYANNQAGATYLFKNVCNAITLSPTTLPGGMTGVNYYQAFTANGANANAASFSLNSGILPNGVTLSSTGVLSGTPTQTGTFFLTVTATDGYGCMGMQSYTLVITCGTLTLTPNPLPFGQAGSAYSQNITALGGNGAVTFSLTSGTLPNGLTLAPNGLLSGTPTQLGNSTFQIKATDANGCNGTQTFTLSINCPPLTFAALPAATATLDYNQTLSASPALGAPYTFALTAGTLPPGLTLLNGVLSGTPTTVGNYNFTLTAYGFNSVCSSSQTYNFAVNCPPISPTPTTLPSVSVGTAYNQTLSATPANNYGFAVTQGMLPPGLTLSTTGVIGGTPTAAGNYAFAITATGFGVCTGTQAYSLLVTNTCATVTLTPSSLAGGMLGATYNQTLSATPAAAYSFSLTSGALPTGVTLNANTGVISGTPTQTGTFIVTFKAASAGGCSGTRTYILTIACAAITLSPATLPNAMAGVAYTQQLTATPIAAYTFSLLTGSLPPGLMLSSTGLLSGTPAQAGTYTFTIKAAQGGCQGSLSYTLTVQ